MKRKRLDLPALRTATLSVTILLFTFWSAALAFAEKLPTDWGHSASGGELATQFPKHPKRRIISDDPADKNSATLGIAQIGIERTQCFGRCPVYTLIIKTDGTFRYHGEKFTPRHGDWSGTIDLGPLARALRYISEMGYFALADEYTSTWTDQPGVYSMVQTRTRKKIIYNYGDCGPAKLGAMEKVMDELLEGAHWKRK